MISKCQYVLVADLCHELDEFHSMFRAVKNVEDQASAVGMLIVAADLQEDPRCQLDFC